jgi:hypothetical protein
MPIWAYNQPPAVQKCVAFGHSILIADEIKNGNRRYTSFLSMDKLHAYMAQLPDNQRHLYMVDPSAMKSKSLTEDEMNYTRQRFLSPLILDVEWTSVDASADRLAEKRLDKLVEVVLRVLRCSLPQGNWTEETTIEKEDLSRIPRGKQTYKNSCHLVFPTVVFEHNGVGCMKSFVLDLMWPELKKEELLWIIKADGTTACIVDSRIYGSARQMRMPGCCKYGGRGRPMPPVEELHRMRTSYYVPDLPEDVAIITEEMLERQCLDAKRIMDAAAAGANGAGAAKISSNGKRKRDKTRTNTEAVDGKHCAELIQMIRQRGDMTSEVTQQDEGTYSVRTNGDRTCLTDPTHPSTHKNNNAKLTVNTATGQVWFYCHSSRCQIPVYIGEVSIEPRKKKKKKIKNEAKEEEEEYKVVSLDDDDGGGGGGGTICQATISNNIDSSVITERYNTIEDELATRIATRKVTTYTTSCARINDDPRFDVTTTQGAEIMTQWNNNVVVVDSYQGSGKTYWLIACIIALLKKDPNNKILFLGPFISLTESVTQRLRVAVADAVEKGIIKHNHGFVISHYKEPGELTKQFDVLMCHSQSMKRFPLKDVNVVVIDEVRCFNEQQCAWRHPEDQTRSNINGSFDLLKALSKQIVILSGANIDDRTREITLNLLGIHTDAEVIQYSHETLGPVKEVHTIKYEGLFQQKLWKDVLDGHRIVVSVKHAKTARKMHKWLQMEVVNYNTEVREQQLDVSLLSVQSVAWTAEWVKSCEDSPARNPTQWMTKHNIQVVFFTNAMSPGMSVDHPLGYWHCVYMYVGSMGQGASNAVMGQMPQRFRHLVDTNLYVYLEFPHSSATTAATTNATIPWTASEQVLRDHKHEAQLYMHDHGSVKGLKPSVVNDSRWLLAVDQMKENNEGTLNGILKYAGNTRIGEHHDTYVPTTASWKKLTAEEKQSNVLATRHITSNEVPLEGEIKIPWTDDQNREATFRYIAKSLAPHLVTKVGYASRLSLTPRSFAVAYQFYDQLLLVQQLALFDRSTFSMQLGHNDAAAKNADAIHSKIANICALADMVAFSGGDTSLVTQGLCMTTSIIGNSNNSNPSYKWLQADWDMVRKQGGRYLPLPASIPKQNDADEWQKCLQRLVKSQTGYDISKQSVTGRSMWTQLGVDMRTFMDWTREQRALKEAGAVSNLFRIVEPSNENCAECDTGEDVPCVQQRGIWRCIKRDRDDKSSHRMVYEPLDVCYNLPVAEEVEEEEKQLTQVVDFSLVDRLLSHVGFLGGATITQSGVFMTTMATAWLRAVVSVEDSTELLSTFKVNLTTVLADRTKMVSLRKRINDVLGHVDLRLDTRRERLE